MFRTGKCLVPGVQIDLELYFNDSNMFLFGTPDTTTSVNKKIPTLGENELVGALWMKKVTLNASVNSRLQKEQSCPILPHCYGPLRAVDGPYDLHKPSLLLTVRMLSTYGACISLLHEGTMRYGSFDPYGP